MTDTLVNPTIIYEDGQPHHVEIHDDFGFVGNDPSDYDIARAFSQTVLETISDEAQKLIEFAKLRERTVLYHSQLVRSTITNWQIQQGPLGANFLIANRDEREAARLCGYSLFHRSR